SSPDERQSVPFARLGAQGIRCPELLTNAYPKARALFPAQDKKGGLSPAVLVSPLFDHFVGECENTGRNFQSKRVGRLAIDDQIKLGWLQDGQIGRFGPLQDPTGVDTCLAMDVEKIGSVTHQAPGQREIAKRIAGRDRILRSECHQSGTPTGVERVGNYK